LFHTSQIGSSWHAAQLLDVNGEVKVVLIPFVVAVDCPFPPSDKIDIYSFQTGKEEIVPMKEMKMAWVPYVPVRTGLAELKAWKQKYSLSVAPSGRLRELTILATPCPVS